MNKKSEGTIPQYPNSIDTRVALLEMSISHIGDTLERMEKRFDKLDERLDKFDGKLDKLDDKIDSRFFWLLSVGMAAFTGLLGVMAHGFHWF